MADWTDGSQYAPLERPEGFAAPRTSALASADPDDNLAEGRPVQPPAAYQEPHQAPELEALVPAAGPERDPQQPFQTAGSAGGAWGAGHAAWKPTMPLGEAPAPAPTGFPPPAISTFPSPAFPPPAGPPVIPSPVATAAAGPVAASAPVVPPAALQQLPPPTGAPVPLPPPTGQRSAAPATPHGPVPAAGWQPEPVRPQPQGLAAYLGGTKGVALGALAFGVLVPSLAYLMIFVSSFLSRSTGRGAGLLRTAYNLVFFVVVGLWIASMSGGYDFGFYGISQALCAVMIGVNLYASHLDSRGTRQ